MVDPVLALVSREVAKEAGQARLRDGHVARTRREIGRQGVCFSARTSCRGEYKG